MRELIDPLLGMIAFLILCGFEMASQAHLVVLKRTTLCVGSALFLFALVRVLMHPVKLHLPAWCMPLGWFISILGGFLLIYSLALEIPFQRTYLTPGASSELVTTATYALTRHPGVLWMAMLLVGLLLVSRSRGMLIAAPAWLLMDVLHVWLQDRVFFPRQFVDYRQYQRQTPMLLPDLVSLRRCWRTLPWQKHGSSSQP